MPKLAGGVCADCGGTAEFLHWHQVGTPKGSSEQNWAHAVVVNSTGRIEGVW